MEIVNVEVSKIVPYERNAKEHPREQIDQIKESIVSFGNNDPIAIDENNVIIEGHGRLIALKELGYKEVDCIIISGLTETQKNTYRLVHNKLTMNSGWDEGMLETVLAELSAVDVDMSKYGFDVPDDGEETEIIEDEVPEVDEESEPTAKRGQVWKLGRHYLMCGDSTIKDDVSRLIDSGDCKTVDALITDPPYGVSYHGEAGEIQNDDLTADALSAFLKKTFANANEHMKSGAAFYIFHASRTAKAFEDAMPWEIRQQLIWNKNCMTLGRQDYQWKHEPCFYGWKEGSAHTWNGGRALTTVLDFDKPNRNEDHPTMKPVALIAHLIENSTNKRETVLDIFGGSGTTLIACEQLNRNCRMMELDPKYCDVIIKRWETMTGEKAVLME